jgi:hypothetical protein
MIALIVLILAVALAAQAWVRGRYSLLNREVQLANFATSRGPDVSKGSDSAVSLPDFRHPFLARVVDDLRPALENAPIEVNTLALIEHRFNTELRSLLFAERFSKTANGLVIVLGLAGTFYGLTLSIGRLVTLVASDQSIAGGDSAASVATLSATLTSGLTQALAGMSVAFTTSLAGISAAVVLTLMGVFANLSERRVALITHLEVVLDRVVESVAAHRIGRDPAVANLAVASRLEAMMHGFEVGMAELSQTVDRFEQALGNFANTGRDLREFNVHLKDNLARMSLAFGDFSESIRNQTRGTLPLPRERG